MKGAPLRFVAGVLGAWTCARIAVLLPGDSPLGLAADVLAPPAAATGRAEPRAPVEAPGRQVATVRGRSGSRSAVQARSPRIAAARGDAPPPAASIVSRRTDAATPIAPPVLVPATLGPDPLRPTPGPLGVSAWLLARGGANGTLSGGMLGGSQAGARVTYALDAGRKVALSARVAAPLRGRGAEAAIGIGWQPTRAPVHLLAEQRFGLDGGRGGPTLMAIAGVNPTPVALGFRLQAYAQVGAIRRGGRTEAFGDAAARLARPILTIGEAAIDAGVGGWAAGQRGAARVDAGPTLGIALPLAGRRIRLSADWRQRIAGDTRPGSGPALSIGTDF